MADWRDLLPFGSPLRENPAMGAQGPPISDAYRALGQMSAAPRRAPADALMGAVAAPAAPMAAPAQAAQAEAPRSTGRTVLVGDSLGVGTSPFLKGIRSNAVVGRSSASGVDALRQFTQQGQVGRVVFDLGTNDATAKQLRHSLHVARELAPGATFIVPTVNGPGAQEKNAMLRHLAGRGLIQLVDWAGQSRGQLAGDGIHASGSGYRRRAGLIERALR